MNPPESFAKFGSNRSCALITDHVPIADTDLSRLLGFTVLLEGTGRVAVPEMRTIKALVTECGPLRRFMSWEKSPIVQPATVIMVFQAVKVPKSFQDW